MASIQLQSGCTHVGFPRGPRRAIAERGDAASVSDAAPRALGREGFSAGAAAALPCAGCGGRPRFRGWAAPPVPARVSPRAPGRRLGEGTGGAGVRDGRLTRFFAALPRAVALQFDRSRGAWRYRLRVALCIAVFRSSGRRALLAPWAFSRCRAPRDPFLRGAAGGGLALGRSRQQVTRGCGVARSPIFFVVHHERHCDREDHRRGHGQRHTPRARMRQRDSFLANGARPRASTALRAAARMRSSASGGGSSRGASRYASSNRGSRGSGSLMRFAVSCRSRC